MDNTPRGPENKMQTNIAPEIDVNLPLYRKHELMGSGGGTMVVPESAPTLAAESEIPVSPELQEQPFWETTRDWKMMQETRLKVIAANVNQEYFNKAEDKLPGETIEEYRKKLQEDYDHFKQTVANNIGEAMTREAGEGLTGIERQELDSRINDTIFSELVKKEHDLYKDLRHRLTPRSPAEEALEAGKRLLKTKAVQWYLGLSRKQRMLCTASIGAFAGLAAGAAVAPGLAGAATYLGWRAFRAGTSGYAGLKANELANKIWSAEELEQAEQKEIQDLKNSALSVEEASKGYEDIEKRYKKARLMMNLKKVGTTLVAGAGTGLLTGLAEHAVMGAGLPAQSGGAVENQGGKGGVLDNRLGPRKGFEPSIKPKAPESQPLGTSEPIATAPTPEPMPTQPEIAPEPEKLFADPSILKHEIHSGDSPWKILSDTLETKDEFRSLTPAQKIYVLSNLTNKMSQNPEAYGNMASLRVGKTFDMSKLFEDTKEVRSILDKAKENISSGSAKENSILLNNEKISRWVHDNPNEQVTPEKVTEILTGKPKLKVEILDKERMAAEGKVSPEAPAAPEAAPAEVPKTIPEEIPKPETPDTIRHEEAHAPINREMLEQEISNAKKRLATLAGGGAVALTGGALRTMSGDISQERLMEREQRDVEEALRSDVNNIYGAKGFAGLGKKDGMTSREWRFMSNLPAARVVEFRTQDSSGIGLAPDVISTLKKPQHEKFLGVMVQLMNRANGLVKPYENENVEQFLKRLGAFLLKPKQPNKGNESR